MTDAPQSAISRIVGFLMRDIKMAWHSFIQGEAVRRIARLGAAVILARVISAAGYVVVARLYAPNEFGVFAVYLAAAVVMTSIAGATYDRAIVTAPSTRRAAGLVLISLGLSIGLALVLFGGLSVADHMVAGVTGLTGFMLVFWAVPLGMILKAGYRTVEQWGIRRGRFRAQGIAHVSGATTQMVLQAGLAYSALPGPYALIVADLAGGLVGLAVIGIAEGPNLIAACRRFRRRLALKSTAVQWLPTYTLPSGLMALAVQTAPVLVLAPVFSAGVVGQAAMAVRILELPYQLAASVFSNIAYHRIAAADMADRVVAFRRAIRQNLALALGIYGGAALLSLPVIPLVLGEQWIMTSQLLIVLVPFYLGLFTTAPLLFIYTIARSESRLLFSRILLVGAVALAWGTAWATQSLWVAFAVFSVLGLLVFAITFADMYDVVRRKSR